MSPAGTATGRIAGSADGVRVATAVAGAGILGGLALVLIPGVPAGLGIARGGCRRARRAGAAPPGGHAGAGPLVPGSPW